MARNFDVISLGVLPLIDTVEGNQNVSQNAVNSWLGTYGSEADPLFNQVLTVTGGNFSGGDPTTTSRASRSRSRGSARRPMTRRCCSTPR